jgi:hypothetical protein
MGRWERGLGLAFGPRPLRIFLFALTCACVPAVAWSATRAPNADEFALLALANSARASQHLKPFVWNDGLGAAARAHSDDEVAHGCYQHDSCGGQTWWKRIQSYYPAWSALAENIASGGSNPRRMHDGWMASPDHRANILGPYLEFGAGIASLDVGDGSQWLYPTEDFGSTGWAEIPTLPAAAVVPRLGFDTDARELLVNYYDAGGAAPQAVRALIGSTCVNLPKIAGSATNGTYGTTRTFPTDGCTPVVFEAIRADGTRYRWPASEAILVGTGWVSLSCAERTTAVPKQDCGGASSPIPTPSATPTPVQTPTTPTPTQDGTKLNALHVSLKPGKTNASRGIVQVQATLPMLADFDPTATPISIHLRFGTSGDWSKTLPQLCGDKACLTLNKRGTVYHAAYDATTSLSLTRGKKSGRWTVHFMARSQSVNLLGSGALTVTLSVDGKTFSGSADAELKQSGLFTG